MTSIRSFHPRDVEKLREIHEKHFKEEFDFPDFLKGFYCAYTIEVEGQVVVTGGVRPIAEAIVITDMDAPKRHRVEALHKMLEASMFTCGVHCHDQLHAFVQDDTWLRQLETVHFRPTKGKSLVFDIG